MNNNQSGKATAGMALLKEHPELADIPVSSDDEDERADPNAKKARRLAQT